MTPQPGLGQLREPATGTRILRGDMIGWSDDDPPAEAVRELVARLVAAGSPRRVLLAGPRTVGMIAALPEHVAVDVLVRGVPDARDASVAAGLHDRARIHSGGLDGLASEEPYDLVVALGGPERLLGPDSSGLDDAAVVRALADRLGSGGVLVTDLQNQLGLHDLVATTPALDPDADEAWHVGAPGFTGRHPYRHELEGLLTEAGLDTRVVLSAYPDPHTYDVLVDSAALDGPDVRKTACWFLTESVTTHFARRPSLRGPRDVAAGVVEARLIDELAPAWVVVATKADGSSSGPTLGELPAVLAEERYEQARWGRLLCVSAQGEVEARWVAGSDLEVVDGKLLRDLSGPVVTNGPVLEDALRHACAARSHRRLRQLVQAYHDWLHDGSVWTSTSADRRIFATPDNVAVTAEATELALVDGSWRRLGIVSGSVVFVHGLRDFSMRLLASGSPHPWRSSVTPDELTTSLAAMAGVVVQPDELLMVSRVVGEIRAIRDSRLEELPELVEADLDAGHWALGLPSPTDIGFRELVMLDRGRARVQREQEGQVGWLEGTLRHRDRYIRELERIIESYEGTLTYRTVQAIRAPRRVATEKAVESAKATARDVLPPDAMSKARRLAQKVMKSSG